MKQTFVDAAIGVVTIQVRSNARNISYRVDSKGLRITAPPIPFARIWPLSTERLAWVVAATEKVRLKNVKATSPFTPTTVLQASTFEIRFEVSETKRAELSAELKEGQLTIYFRDGVDISTAERQRGIETLIVHFLKKEAQRVLPTRLNSLAARHGFRINGIKINTARRRWGSCSSARSVNLSCFLMLLSEEVVDLVLLHELCHTEVMNHSEKFYARLRPLVPNYEATERRLRQEERQVKSYFK